MFQNLVKKIPIQFEDMEYTGRGMGDGSLNFEYFKRRNLNASIVKKCLKN